MTETNKTRDFGKPFMLYKARSSGDGSASQWSIGSIKDCVFLEMTKQNGKHDNGNARFDWENKIRFQLKEPDIGEILAVLMGVQQGVGPSGPSDNNRRHKGLFHSNNSGNAILRFEKDSYNGSVIFKINLSVKKDGVQTLVQHSISRGEACILGILLRRAVEIMYRWD